MDQVHACNCIGPQNGDPRCPCQMRGMTQRDGRWIEPERDLGPVVEPSRTTIPPFTLGGHGCICPPGSEKSCRGALCPRQPIGPATS